MFKRSVTEDDLRRVRDGVKRCLQLVATGAFDAAFPHVGIDPTGTGLETLSDDAAIDAWLMATVGDTGHIGGTCRTQFGNFQFSGDRG